MEFGQLESTNISEMLTTTIVSRIDRTLDVSLEMKQTVPMTILFCVLYTVVFVFGVVGNYFVVAVVARSPRMRTVTNLLVSGLAVADMLVVVCCLPFNLVTAVFTGWILGRFLCYMLPFIQGVAVSASVNLLVAISLDRYFSICRWSMSKWCTNQNARRVIVLIWVYSALVISPWLAYYEVVEEGELVTLPTRNFTVHVKMATCRAQWPSRAAEQLHLVVVILFLLYVFPLVVVCVCYAKIFGRVSRGRLEQQGEEYAQHCAQSKVRVAKTFLVVVLIFATCWLPLYMLVVLWELYRDVFLTQNSFQLLNVYLHPLATWLGVASSSINPLVYAFYHESFRAGFIAIWRSRSLFGDIQIRLSGGGSSSRSMGSRHHHRNASKSHSLHMEVVAGRKDSELTELGRTESNGSQFKNGTLV